MSAIQFKKATKHEAKLRLALVGVSGSGKSYTSLAIATGLGGKVAAIDTEKGSLSKYADLFTFDVLELESFHPQTYIDAIHAAEGAGFDVLIIDSLSHAWMGKDGALELVDKASKRPQNSGNSFSAWRDVTPLHTALIDAILGTRMHVIATMRSKTEYVMEQGKNGKMTPRKVGMAAVQRDGMEYEFDVVGDLNQEHELIISKTRCMALTDGVFSKPGKDIADILNQWLKGEKQPEKPVLKAVPATVAGADQCEATGSQQAQRVTEREAALLRELAIRKGVDIDKKLRQQDKPQLECLSAVEAQKIHDWLKTKPDLNGPDEQQPQELTATQQQIQYFYGELARMGKERFADPQGQLQNFNQFVASNNIEFNYEVQGVPDIPDEPVGKRYVNYLADLVAANQSNDDPLM